MTIESFILLLLLICFFVNFDNPLWCIRCINYMKLFKTTAIIIPMILAITVTIGCAKTNEQASAAKQLAHITAESARVTFSAIKGVDGLDEQQIKCIESIDVQPLEQKVQTILEKDFTKDELAKLNEVHSSDAARAFTNYGRDQIIVAFGGTIKEPAPKPTEAQVKQIMDFSNTELGQKYTKLNDSVAEGSMTSEVNKFIGAALDKCHVDIDM